MEIQRYTPDRAVEIADLFHQSVHAIDSSFYTSEQKEVWAPTPPDYAFWEQRLLDKKPILAIIDNQVAGFIELDRDGHIDCAYTHPNYQGQGVASTLYQYVLKIARSRRLSRLYVEASLIAMPFFEKRGFVVVKKNELHRQGLTLINFDMELLLDN
ncbi:GNAT family N-acetyltransferase [Vibrio hannami]|uniref:GNAT family N-acetyltransferase n=1 Tax=Vibrio hannami TaxID=2717094 RepID=UPI00240F8459|nr:GNAT family N-acetyltransferase [Vibrio hannami]MDG3086219.1 GNAT family N-acetyltransferase [Vibrio hannami]